MVTPPDDFESCASQKGIEERRAAGLEEVETLPYQRLRRERTPGDENHFKRKPVFAEDAGILSDIKRGGAVKTVEANMQNRGLSRRKLRAHPPESRNQDCIDGDPFHITSIIYP